MLSLNAGQLYKFCKKPGYAASCVRVRWPDKSTLTEWRDVSDQEFMYIGSRTSALDTLDAHVHVCLLADGTLAYITGMLLSEIADIVELRQTKHDD